MGVTMTPAIEEVAGWLRELSGWFGEMSRLSQMDCTIDLNMSRSKMWAERAAQVEAMGWRPITDKSNPPHGVPVLLWAEEWVDEDFNPTGVRVGHFTEGDGYTSCGWDARQDVFTTEDESSPTLWVPLPQPPVKK